MQIRRLKIEHFSIEYRKSMPLKIMHLRPAASWCLDKGKTVGGDFDRTQTLYSRLASVNMWDKTLTESDIVAQYTNAAYLMVLFLTGLR